LTLKGREEKMRIDYEGEWIITYPVSLKEGDYFVVSSSKDKHKFNGHRRYVPGKFNEETWALKVGARRMWGIGLKYAPDFVKSYAY
jgi:hypothetical protein